MPERIAAIDLLAQAEHDENAQSILITNDKVYALKVEKEIENYLKRLKRKKLQRVAGRNLVQLSSFQISRKRLKLKSNCARTFTALF